MVYCTSFIDQIIIMCKKLVLGSSLETIENRFCVVSDTRIESNPSVLVSPGERTLIITQQEPKRLMLSSFGLTPSRAKEPMQLINARAEGNKNPKNDPLYSGGKAIFMKPSFKRPLVSQRCIIIADAFVEWSTVTRQPYLVYLRERERPFGMAGLYDIWIHPETKIEYHGFTIITAPGNALIHQLPATRMPVIIPKGREVPWLRSSNHLSDVLGMLERFPAEKMNAYPIGKDFDKSPQVSAPDLKLTGDRIYSEVERKVIPHSRWGHKEKGAGGRV